MNEVKNMASKDKNGNTYGTGRTRNYATIVYQESAPSDWLSVAADFKIPMFISPLHKDDVNEKTGEPKKPHWHVMIMFDSVKTKEQAAELFEQIGGVGVEVVQVLRSYARYLCHLDHPTKAQYSTDDVRCFGGADYTDIIGLPVDKYKAIGEMLDYLDLHTEMTYYDLLMYARQERFDWFRVLCDSGTYVIKECIKSRRSGV
jgi:hypothetical protein